MTQEADNPGPDITEDIERIRGDLLQMRNSTAIAAAVRDIALRERIRDAYADKIPGGLAGKLDVRMDERFGHLLIAITRAQMLGDDPESGVRRLASVVAAASRQDGQPTQEPQRNGTDGRSKPEQDAVRTVLSAPPGSAGTPVAPTSVEASPELPEPPASSGDGPAPGSHLRLVSSTPGPAGEHPVGSDGVPALVLPLFVNETPGPVSFLPSVLAPAPPAGAPISRMIAWLSGSWHDPDGISIIPGRLDDRFDITDLEVELRADSERFLANRDLFPRIDATSFMGYDDWIRRQAQEDGAVLEVDHAQALRKACERVLGRFYPAAPMRMAGVSAQLEIGENLGPALAWAIGTEGEWLSQGEPDEEGRPPQHMNATINPDHAFAPGMVLDRAVACHFLIGTPIACGLTLALAELRSAQVIRQHGDWEMNEAFLEFDKLFFTDCRRPLDAYTMGEEIEVLPEP